MAKAAPTRMSLSLSKDLRRRLERLVRLSEAESAAQVIRRALALYELALVESSGGGQLLIEYPSGAKDTLLLLEAVRGSWAS